MKRITIALAASLVALPAFAADLNGGAIPDLEERVAELEATTARKGNRKVTLVISGQVNKALLWHDIDGLAGANSARVVNNANSPSVVRFEGAAKMSASFSAGFLYEFGIDETRGKLLFDALPSDDITLRHAAAWISTPIGKVTLGQTSMATDGAGEISVANTAIASRLLSNDPLWTYANLPEALNPMGFDGGRAQIVRYDTPTFAGFMLSASWAGGQTQTLSNLPAALSPLGNLIADDMWDVALRYSGEISGFRMAAGVGYRVESYTIPMLAETRTVVGSASMMHMPTGLFANVAFGRSENGSLFGDSRAIHIQAGIERNFLGFGATTAYGEFYELRLTDAGVKADVWGAGLVQAIDALGADLYASFRVMDIEGFDARVGMVGLRVRF
jgi:predicted porin